MLESLKKTHPRLMVENFDMIAAKIDKNAYVKAMFEKLKQDCEQMAADPNYYMKGNDIIKAQNRIFKYCLVYKMTQTAVYKTEAFKNIHNMHRIFHEVIPTAVTPILSVGMMGEALAVAYDWLYDAWNEEEKKLLIHILKEHVVEHMLLDIAASEAGDDTRGDILWVKDYNNVQHIACAGGILASLAIGEVYPGICETLMDKLIHKVFNIDLYRPNGVYPEGQYWNYSIYNIVLAFSAMEAALGTDFGFSDKPGMANTGYFNIVSTGPADGNQMKFADANPMVDRRVHNNPAMHWMGKRYGRPEYIWWEKYVTDRGEEFRFPDRVMSIIWYEKEFDTYGDNMPKLPLLNVLEGDRNMLEKDIEAFASVITIRDKWFDKNSAWVGLKAGGNPTHHGQLDVGNIMVAMQDIDILTELGWENYNKKGQFEGINEETPWHASSPRWLYYRNRGEGHNTLVINPGSRIDQNIPAFAPVLNSGDSEAYGFAIIDMTELYNGVTQVLRGIKLLHNKNQVIIQDEIKGLTENDICWFAHTRGKVELLDSVTAKLSFGKKEIYAMVTTSSGKGTWSIREAKRFSNSPIPLEEDSSNEGIVKLCVNVIENNETIMVMFSDKCQKPEIIPMSQWKFS